MIFSLQISQLCNFFLFIPVTENIFILFLFYVNNSNIDGQADFYNRFGHYWL